MFAYVKATKNVKRCISFHFVGFIRKSPKINVLYWFYSLNVENGSNSTLNKEMKMPAGQLELSVLGEGLSLTNVL